MANLVEVHIKVQELSRNFDYISVGDVAASFEDSFEDILDHLRSLTHIDYVDPYALKTGRVLLTLSGRLTIPFRQHPSAGSLEFTESITVLVESNK